MSHLIEFRNNKFSFAENGGKELKHRAWHGLGEVFDRPMFVQEALEACQANYNVSLQPIVALTPQMVEDINAGRYIDPQILADMMINKYCATMRTDVNKTLGIVSDSYGIVQNADAFSFIDLLCSGKIADRDKCPTIEACGVLGDGERVFITAKFNEQIVLDAQRNDLMDMYAIFTTSHDGSGAVTCVISGVRVVCNNTLQLALRNNIGRLSFRHTSRVMERMDLLKSENAEFAYKTLNVAELYTKELKESYDHLRNIRISENDLNNILAQISFSDKDYKLYKETNNIFHEDLSGKGRAIFLRLHDSVENGVGQDILESGNAQWALNGITSYFQNVQNYKNDEAKMDSIVNGNAGKKVQKAYELLLNVA